MAKHRHSTSERARGFQQGSRFSRDVTNAAQLHSQDLYRNVPYPEADTRAADSRATDAPASSPYSRASGAAHYREANRRSNKRKKRLLIGLIGTLVVALVALGIFAALYMHKLNQDLRSGIDDDLYSQLSSTEFGQPFYMLLLGVDKSQERVASGQFGSGNSGYRSDSIILARIDPQNCKVTLVSIPRDTKVDLGEYGVQKINAAYTYGGQALITQKVSELAGVPISHFAEIDFDQFTSIVDTIGGIEVTLPVAVQDSDAGIDLPAGTQTLNGAQALGLSRARHAYDQYGAGDFYRQANQRMVIAAILKKVLAQGPSALLSSVPTLASSITTDLDVQSMLALAAQMSKLNVDTDIYSGMLPTNSVYSGGIWWQEVDSDAWTTMMQRVEAGESPYSSTDQDTTAGIAGSVGTISNTSTSEDASSDSTSSSTSSSENANTGKVCVLNATNTNGLAKRVADYLSNEGYTTKADSSTDKTNTTYIYYNGGDTGKAKAEAIAEKLGGSMQVVANNSVFSTEYDVIVVLGSDATNLSL